MTVLQTAKNTGTSVTSLVIPFPAPTAVGSGVVVLVDSRSLDATVIVTDSAGNTYTPAGEFAQNGSATPNRIMLFYRAATGATAGVTTVTVNPSAAHNMGARIFEVPGLGALVDTDKRDAQADVEGLPVTVVATGNGFSVGAMAVGVTSRAYAVLTPAGATQPADDPLTQGTTLYMMTAWKDVTAGSVAYEWDRTAGTASLAGMFAAVFGAAMPASSVNAGPDQTVVAGSGVVTLGPAVGAPGGGTYAWTEQGPLAATDPVVLSGAGTDTATYQAPATPGERTFRVTYTPSGASPSVDDVSVIHTAPAAPTVGATETLHKMIDARTLSSAPTALAHTSGTEPAAVLKLEPDLYLVELPAQFDAGDMVLTLTATDGAGQATPKSITITPKGGTTVIGRMLVNRGGTGPDRYR